MSGDAVDAVDAMPIELVVNGLRRSARVAPHTRSSTRSATTWR